MSSTPSGASLRARAVLSVLLLGGFYGTTVVASVALLAFGLLFVLFVSPPMLKVILLAVTWIPAASLAAGLVSVRAPRFVPPGRRLSPEEAPGLFALIDELAAAVQTAPPSEVYIDPLMTLAVTERGGIFGGRRVLIVGGQLFNLASVQELRAGLAHELGHLVGGDTRLSGIVSYTCATFASVLSAGDRDPFRVGTSHVAIEGGFAVASVLSKALVYLYAEIYFRVTHALSRRQEMLADVFAARLAGTRAASSLLEKVSRCEPLYVRYVGTHVAFAVARGAMPTDLWDGFLRFRHRLDASQAGQSPPAEVLAKRPDPHDAHPPVTERLRAFSASPQEPARRDDSPSTTLLSPAFDLDGWLWEATSERLVKVVVDGLGPPAALRQMPWERVATDVYLPVARESARQAAEALFPMFPDARTVSAMFARAVAAAAGGMAPSIALNLDGRLSLMDPVQRARSAERVVTQALSALFQGALLEHGASLDESLGEPCLMFELGGERVPAAQIVVDAMQRQDAVQTLMHWAGRLTRAETPHRRSTGCTASPS
jgi:Zn-dependent protease with chaperone function